jgi:hypothetical protein
MRGNRRDRKELEGKLESAYNHVLENAVPAMMLIKQGDLRNGLMLLTEPLNLDDDAINSILVNALIPEKQDVLKRVYAKTLGGKRIKKQHIEEVFNALEVHNLIK